MLRLTSKHHWQAQIHDFVREGEMMRCAVHPHIAKLLGEIIRDLIDIDLNPLLPHANPNLQ
jgi:hypothetical protein